MVQILLPIIETIPYSSSPLMGEDRGEGEKLEEKMFKNLKFLLVLMSLLFSGAALADDAGTPAPFPMNRSRFDSTTDYLVYFDPAESVWRFKDLTPLPVQIEFAQVIFSNMTQTADSFFALNPDAEAVRLFLEMPLRFSREAMRNAQTAALVIDLQRAVAPQVFERATSVSEWVRIATFTPVSAAEFESVAAEIVYQNFDSLLKLNPSLNQIKELLSGKLGFNGNFKVLKLFCERLPQGEGYTGGFIAERTNPIEVAERFVEFLLSPSSFYEADSESVVARSGRELLVKILKSMIERQDVRLRVVVDREKMLALKEVCRAAGYEMITSKITSRVVFPAQGPEHVSYEITRLGRIPGIGENFDHGARRGSETVRVGNATGEVHRDEAPREGRSIVDRFKGWFRARK